jgi:hypothetical protein
MTSLARKKLPVLQVHRDDWCHVCGGRRRLLCDSWGGGGGHGYLRICVVCVEDMQALLQANKLPIRKLADGA